MLTETQLSERLHAATEQIDVEFSIEDVIGDRHAPTSVELASIARPRRAVAVLAAFLVVGLAAALTIRTVAHDPSADGANSWQPPVTSVPGTPRPGTNAPHVTDPPPSVGEIAPSRRIGAQRTGDWVGLAIAQPAVDGYQEPIAVFATTGSWSVLDSASPVTIGGRDLVSAQFGRLTVLATTGSPRLIATGRRNREGLAEILTSAETARVDGMLLLRLTTLPVGYLEVVPPRGLTEDTPVRRSLTNTVRTLSINEISDWSDVFLAAASTGSDLQRVQVGNLIGWTGLSEAASSPRFLMWSPAPGIIFEIDTTDDEISTDDLVRIARATTPVANAQWDQIYSR